MGKAEDYELENFLQDVREAGFGSIKLTKLYRLLEKANRAAGTWRKLRENWIELFPEAPLFIIEMPWEIIMLSTRPVTNINDWC